jgi:SAM-dependent methyltransferase
MLVNNSSDEAEKLDQQKQHQAQTQEEDDDDDDFAPLILSKNDGVKDARHEKEDETTRADDDDDNDDDDEKVNATKAEKSKLPTRRGGRKQEPSLLPGGSKLLIVVFAVLLLFFAVIFMAKKNAITGERAIKPSLPQYSCPVSYTQEEEQEQATPKFNPDEPKLYLGQDAMILANITDYIEHYQDVDFDEWDANWHDFKQNRSNFITRRFGPNLQSGSSIYESACGIGLNLALTLEVLYESLGISDLVVYGNDFVKDSIVVANALLIDGGILPANGKIGRLCHGDSMDLSHVPSNAFDLVFTGYVTPLQNPLQLNLGSTSETHSYYKHQICSKHAAAAAMQEKQEAWWAAWVGEMVRLAKPGVPIIFEGVSRSLCVEPDDWGGVEEEFWYSGVEKYDWDVDVESIEMEPDLMSSSRYHVFMRKSSNAEP